MIRLLSLFLIVSARTHDSTLCLLVFFLFMNQRGFAKPETAQTRKFQGFLGRNESQQLQSKRAKGCKWRADENWLSINSGGCSQGEIRKTMEELRNDAAKKRSELAAVKLSGSGPLGLRSVVQRKSPNRTVKKRWRRSMISHLQRPKSKSFSHARNNVRDPTN